MTSPAPRAALLASLVLAAAPAHAAPSFNCARVTAAVNKLICASRELSQLDSKLANDFAATKTQGGIDAKSLQKSEDQWLATTRNLCDTAPCLKQAYLARDAAILDQSLRAASPAAYDDTRPFPAPAGALSAALALVGQTTDGPATPLPGTSKIPGYQTIVGPGLYVIPSRLQTGDFAFLLACPETSASHCQVRDVVALPTGKPGLAFLQCHDGTDSHGFGIRQPHGQSLAYWSIDNAQAKIRREPIHVTGEQDLRCQEPESGE